MKMNRIYYIMAALLFCAASINAQVRIGKNDDPHKGAMLDLRSDEIENKGILLPRVELTSLSSFSPIEGTATKGMLIYNIGNDVVPEGLYIWSGKWIMLGEASGGTDPVDPNLPGTVEDWITVEEETPVTGEGTEENPYINDCSSAETVTLTAKDGYIFGTVSPTEAATPGEDGSLTFIASGNVAVSKGSQSGVIYVEIEECGEPNISVESVSVSPTSASIIEGNTRRLTATIFPDNATNDAVAWSTNKASVATVDENGLVTAVAVGTATITVTTADGNKTAECTVTVNGIKVTDVSLPSTLTIVSPGGKERLTATVLPENASDKTVSWKSNKTSVATVDDRGVVTGVSVGTATITATANDGSGKTAISTITVDEALFSYEVANGVYEKNYSGNYLTFPDQSDASVFEQYFTAANKTLRIQNKNLSSSSSLLMTGNEAASACSVAGGRLPTLYELAALAGKYGSYGMSGALQTSTERNANSVWLWLTDSASPKNAAVWSNKGAYLGGVRCVKD